MKNSHFFLLYISIRPRGYGSSLLEFSLKKKKSKAKYSIPFQLKLA